MGARSCSPTTTTTTTCLSSSLHEDLPCHGSSMPSISTTTTSTNASTTTSTMRTTTTMSTSSTSSSTTTSTLCLCPSTSTTMCVWKVEDVQKSDETQYIEKQINTYVASTALTNMSWLQDWVCCFDKQIVHIFQRKISSFLKK